MKNLYDGMPNGCGAMPNGYLESIQKRRDAVRYFSGTTSFGAESQEELISRQQKEIETADAVVVGAGAGLSASIPSPTRKTVGRGGRTLRSL